MESKYSLLYIIYISWTVCYCSENEKKLYSFLFEQKGSKAYNKFIVPSNITNQPVEVRLKFILVQLIAVNERRQSIETNIWLNVKWKDNYFQWNPNLFGGITEISIPVDQIWTPDIILLNNVNEKYENFYPVNALIYHNSLVHWIPPLILKSQCTIDVKYFPFDRQMASLKFASWTHSGKKIDLKLQCPDDENMENNGPCSRKGEVDLSEYTHNGEFGIIHGKVEQNRIDYMNNSFMDVSMYLYIQRRPTYYLFNLLIPGIIISSLALLVFIITPDAGEKISLGITVLLSMIMLMFVISEKLPQTSMTIPIISIYFGAIMIMCCLSIGISVFVLNIHHQPGNCKPVPSLIKRIINNWLAKIMFMKHQTNMDESNNTKKVNEVEVEMEKSNSPTKVDSFSLELRRIMIQLKTLTEKIKANSEEELLIQEWRFTARVIDRFCLIIFSLFSIILTITVLISFPKNEIVN